MLVAILIPITISSYAEKDKATKLLEWVIWKKL